MERLEGSYRLAVLEAAQQLATGRADNAPSSIPQIRELFGLNLHEAAAVCKEAYLLRARAR